MLVSIFALTQTTKTRAIKARVETHTLTFAYVIAQQARGLPWPFVKAMVVGWELSVCGAVIGMTLSDF